jgi:hypothetical protein
MRHGQRDFFTDLGGAQLDLEVLDRGLQGRHTVLGWLLCRWPARLLRLKPVQRRTEEFSPQCMKAPPTDAQQPSRFGDSPFPGERFQDQAEPSLSLGTSLQALKQS